MGRFFLEKIFKRVAYKKIKIKNGKEVEVQMNLGFLYFEWHGPSNPTTLEDESWWTFEEFVGRD